jgi:hypothetical protein
MKKIAVAAAAVLLSGNARAETHRLPLAPENARWGYFDASVAPVLRIASGDLVEVETMVARGLERMILAGAPEESFPGSIRRVESEVKERGPGPHPLTGPIAVKGAEPGDILEIRTRPSRSFFLSASAAFSPTEGPSRASSPMPG